MQHIQNNKICKNCKINAIKDYERGEYFCPGCGEIIISEIYDMGLETKFSENNSARTGTPGSQFTTEIISTDIDLKNKDVYGKSFNLKSRMVNNTLRLWQKRLKITTITDKNLLSAIAEVERICNYFSLSEDIKKECIDVYKELVQNGIAKGKSISGLICSTVYIVALKNSIPINLEEINRIAKVKKRRITKIYKLIVTHLKLNLELPTITTYIQKYITYTDIINVNQLNQLKQLCLKFIDYYQDSFESGKGPLTVTCALIYILATVCNIEFSLNDFLKKIKITKITFKVKVNNLINLFLQDNKFNLDTEILNKLLF